MNAILYGATGMLGSAVLLECLEDARIDKVLVIGRRPCGVAHDKVEELILTDFTDYSAHEATLTGYDACFFCLGVSSFRMDEEKYRHLTYDLTLAAGRTLAQLNPEMTFCYVTGEGTDSSEAGGVMWARVKGKTENDLLALPFKAAYMFRPAYIHPEKGVTTRTPIYRFAYALMSPLYPLLKKVAPGYMTTTTNFAQAMIAAATQGYEKPVLDSHDINALATRASA